MKETSQQTDDFPFMVWIAASDLAESKNEEWVQYGTYSPDLLILGYLMNILKYLLNSSSSPFPFCFIFKFYNAFSPNIYPSTVINETIFYLNFSTNRNMQK